MQLSDLLERPEGGEGTIVVPFPYEHEILLAVGETRKRGLADFVFIGESERIRQMAATCDVNLDGIEVIEEADEKAACDLSARVVAEGRADILMKGLVQTSVFSKGFLDKSLGLVAPGSLLSHIAFFEVPGFPKPFIVTDAALNIAPDRKAKGRILENAVVFARDLGITHPRVACLSAVEKVNEKIPSTVDANALVGQAKEGAFGNAVVEGPYAMDVAISRKAAEIKGIEGDVPGKADILLMPNIETGNVLYKTLTNLCNARSASVIAGIRVPVIMNSRSDDPETRLLSIALAVRLCHARRVS